MNGKLFILGAKDPEMDAIASMLLQLGYDHVEGAIKGERCNRTNAYTLDRIYSDKELVFIESSFEDKVEAIHCDHHNVGDHGYELDHSSFLAASSIGQVLKLIIRNDFDHAVKILGLQVSSIFSIEEDYFFDNGHWNLACNGQTVTICEDVVFIAAFDHCSFEMYQGKCAGVKKDGLVDRRIKALSESLDLTPKAVEAKFKELDSIVTYKKDGILDLTFLDLGHNYSLEYLVIRELSLIKSVPIAVMTSTTSKEEIIFKLMLLALTPEQVHTVLEEKKFNNFQMVNTFGVPSRGYAGGEIA